ncbi:response regulator [Candidatus Nomurabacteria bacterium]|nr:response regulator [Candidatus Nomurabacteria bacterium]
METDQIDNHTKSNDRPLADKVVLWIEDDILLTEIIRKKMQKLNTELLHAYDSGGAFKLLVENKKPDIIFLDILLPGMNGYEILEKLKADENTKSIPVIILSNFGQKSEIEKGLNLGAERFLIKATMTLDEVFQEADAILRKHAA